MRLLGLIFDNLGLKTLALCMAWAVWFMVSQSLTDEKTVPLRLEIAVDDSNQFEATPVPADLTTVTVTVAGPVRLVEDFERMATSSVAMIHVGRENYPPDEERQAVFRLEDVEIRQLADFPALRVTAMDPKEIRLNVERMEMREVPVGRPAVPKTVGTASVRVVTWDTVVKIRASANNLRTQLATLKTSVDAAALKQAAESIGDAPSITVPVDLTLDPDQAKLFTLVDRDEITVRLELRHVEIGTFAVPVRILRRAGRASTSLGNVHFSPGNDMDMRLSGIYEKGEDGAPPTLRLTLEGSPAAIAAVDPERLIAFVLEDDMSADDEISNLPVHVAGLPVGVRLKPQPLTLSVERDR